MEPRYLQLLKERKEKGSVRSLLSFEGMVDFWSNDYLGLAQIATPVTMTGSTGSRLISGNSTIIEEVEQTLSTHFGSEAALIFNSGYDANVGFFSSVPQRGDTIIYDEYIHASVRDGIRMSYARSFSFRHNDTADLQSKLKKATGTVFVAIESIYSMDGDLSPLKAISDVCEQENALLVVDEAHGGGVFGPRGKGLTVQEEIHQKCFARLYTFGKAFGAHGAVICCSDELRTYLINFARSFIYTTALPEAFYTHIQQQVGKAASENLRTRLREVINCFTKQITSPLSHPASPIQVIPYPTTAACKEAATRLQQNGFAVKAILPPTVPEGGQRLRICLHTFNTSEEIDGLVKLL